MVVRFSECDTTLWKRILISIYNIKGLKASSYTLGAMKGGFWEKLLNDDSETTRIRGIVESGMQIIIGEGKSTLFWHDSWCSGGPLKLSFPRLFSISNQRDVVIRWV